MRRKAVWQFPAWDRTERQEAVLEVPGGKRGQISAR